MHDHHAVQALIERLTSSDVRGVAEVRIRAGPALSPEALEQAYEMLTPGTPLEGSRLVVQTSAEPHTCLACGNVWDVRCEDVIRSLLICPSCGIPTQVENLGELVVIGISP